LPIAGIFSTLHNAWSRYRMATVLVYRFVRFEIMLMALLGGFAKCHKSVI